MQNSSKWVIGEGLSRKGHIVNNTFYPKIAFICTTWTEKPKV